MSATLPAYLDPWQAVAREATFVGSFALTDLPRLRELLVGDALDATARVTFEIAFRRDEAGRPVVLGRVQAVLPLECQRCLGVVEHRVDAPVRLMLAQGPDLARDPPEPYEALPVIEDRVRPADLVEDELLLTLPQIPMHPAGACQAAGWSEAVAGPALASGPTQDPAAALAPGQATPDRPNPFGVLAGWKTESENRT